MSYSKNITRSTIPHPDQSIALNPTIAMRTDTATVYNQQLSLPVEYFISYVAPICCNANLIFSSKLNSEASGRDEIA